MIFFPYELVRIYQQERIAKAEHYWQLEQIRAGQPRLPAHPFPKISDFLVAIGRKLKAQFKQSLAVLTKVEGMFEDWFKYWLLH